MTARQDELGSERDFLLASLEELEREHAAGDLADEDYASLRAAYVARAAGLLRELEELGPATAAAAPPPRRGLRRRLGTRRARRLLVATGCACLAGLAAVTAAALAGARLPGQAATGTVSLPRATAVAQELDQAGVLGSSGQVAAAIGLYEQVLATAPHQPEALAYLGWLERLSGRAKHDPAAVAAGDASIAEAVRVAPSYPDARAFFGIALLEDRHDRGGGLAELRAFLGDRPSAALLDGLGPSLVTTFRAEHAPVPAALARFARAARAR